MKLNVEIIYELEKKVMPGCHFSLDNKIYYLVNEEQASHIVDGKVLINNIWNLSPKFKSAEEAREWMVKVRILVEN